MALIKYGGGIIQMSGSIAGNTFARNRYGNYVRARTKPVNPNTAAQSSIRSAIAQMCVRWSQTLTAPQRTAWNLYASNVAMNNKLGESIHLSGFNHYIRSNSILSFFSKALVDDGPTVFELPEADPGITISASEGTQLYAIAFNDALDWANETGGFCFMFQGVPQNPQRNFFDGPYTMCGAIAGDDAVPPATPSAAGAKYGIAEGQHIWMRFRIGMADGRLSSSFRDDAFVAA